MITNLIVIVGWFFVFRQTLTIKRRDDLRKIVDLSTKTIEEIYDLSVKYYENPNLGHINSSSASIRAKFVLLSHCLVILRSEDLTKGVSPALTAFKIHAMGGYFETVDFLKQKDMPDWRIELASSSQELRFRVEKGFLDWSKRYSKLHRLKTYTG